jgi:hypothetical protein
MRIRVIATIVLIRHIQHCLEVRHRTGMEKPLAGVTVGNTTGCLNLRSWYQVSEIDLVLDLNAGPET